MAVLQTLGILNALLQGGGGIAGMLGAGERAPQQVNPYTDQVMAQLNEAIAGAMGLYEAGLGEQRRAASDVRGTERRMGDIGRDIQAVEQPGAMDWYDNWLGAVPGYQQIAGELAETATQDLGRSIEEQVQLDTQRAVTEAQNQFAGARGGAAQAALGQAIAQPMAAGRSQMLGQKAGIESQAFGQLAGQGQQLSAAGTQNEFANALQTLIQSLGTEGQIGASQMGRGGQALQSAGMGAQLAGQFSGQRAGLADPIYVEQENPFAALISGLGGGLSSLADPSYGFSWTGSKAPAAGVPVNIGEYKYASDLLNLDQGRY